MRILGGDVSSSATGLLLADNEAVVAHAVWEPPPRADRPDSLVDFEKSLDGWLDRIGHIDAAIVEEPGGGGLGFRVVRSMAHFEGVTLLVLGRRQVIIRQIKAGKARNLVLGLKVTASKEQTLAAAWERWPWLEAHGEHVTDAYIQTQAWPILLKKGLA